MCICSCAPMRTASAETIATRRGPWRSTQRAASLASKRGLAGAGGTGEGDHAALLQPAIAGDLDGARDGGEREAARRREAEFAGNLADQRVGEILRDADLRQLLLHGRLDGRAARHVVPGQRRELRLEHAAHVLHLAGERVLAGRGDMRRSRQSAPAAGLPARRQCVGRERFGNLRRRAALLEQFRMARLRRRAARCVLRAAPCSCGPAAHWRRRCATSMSMAATTSTSSPTRPDDRITASGPSASRTWASAERMSGRCIFEFSFFILLRLSAANRGDHSHLAVVRQLVPREHVQSRYAHAEEPRQRRSQCRRCQQHRRLAATFLTLCGFL